MEVISDMSTNDQHKAWIPIIYYIGFLTYAILMEGFKK